MKKEPVLRALLILYRILDLSEAGVTDLLSLELGNTALASAEVAAGVVLGENDLIAFYVYFDRIGVCNIHFLAHFLGNYNSSELVYVSNYTC